MELLSFQTFIHRFLQNNCNCKSVKLLSFVSFFSRTSTRRTEEEASLRVSTLSFQKRLRLSLLKLSLSCRVRWGRRSLTQWSAACFLQHVSAYKVICTNSAAAPIEPTDESVAAPQSIGMTVTRLVFIYHTKTIHLNFCRLKFNIKIINEIRWLLSRDENLAGQWVFHEIFLQIFHNKSL